MANDPKKTDKPQQEPEKKPEKADQPLPKPADPREEENPKSINWV